MRSRNSIVFLSLLLIGYLFSTCTDSLVIPPEELNNLPKPNITGISSSTVYAPSDTIRIICTATDKDQADTLFNFSWESEFGSFLRAGAQNVKTDTAYWIAPLEEGVFDIRVMVSDNISEVYDTATVVVQSDPDKPGKPFNPSPKNNSTGLGVYQVLKWQLITSAQGLKFDLHFGTDPQPPLYDTNLTILKDTLENLSYNTQYFWKVVAKKDDTTFTTSDVWTFTTRRELEGGDASKFEFVNIPAGDFTSGSKDSLVVKNIDYNYKIMKYEVTNAEYKEFLELVISDSLITNTNNKLYAYYDGNEFIPSGKYLLIDLQSEKSKLKYNGSTVTIESGYENHPVAMVTWFGANLFAKYYGGKLPTADEWEKTARGNTGYDFPWGDEIDSSRANYNYSDQAAMQTTPVGSYNGQNVNSIQTIDSPSQYGCYDMAGNVWEWTSETAETSFQVAGGSWFVPYYAQYSWQTYAYDAEVVYPYIGFRIVKID